MELHDKAIVITGGYGFLGSHVCAVLAEHGSMVCDLRRSYSGLRRKEYGRGKTFRFHRSDYDLTDESQVLDLYRETLPDVVIHLAATVGGIGINARKPGTFCYENLLMGAFILEHARLAKIDKCVLIGTVCCYPKYTPVPFKEEDLWNGFPEETNAPYGLAKKMMLVLSQGYRQEFGFNSIFLLPVNLYGPGDNFNPDTSHVIPAIIKKCVEARNANLPSITCWGSGSATREFLYVKDAATAIVAATKLYDDRYPINLGAGSEISIKDLVELIMKLTGYRGTVVWDQSKPDGQPRRCLDTTKAKALLNFSATTKLEDGLAATIEWYERHCQHPSVSR